MTIPKMPRDDTERKNVHKADIDIGDHEVRPHGDHGKGQKGRHKSHDGSEHEKDPIDIGRCDVLLEEQFQTVSNGLQYPDRTDIKRPVPMLNVTADLALNPVHDCHPPQGNSDNTSYLEQYYQQVYPDILHMSFPLESS
jgi:hypothetical protein